jgi:cytidylate kinase
MIIAIDGPAASGKGTLSRRLADHFGLRHLDTGLTYRAVAAALLAKRPAARRRGGRDRDRAQSRSCPDGQVDVLSAHEIGEAASRIAVLPDCARSWSSLQRNASPKSRRAPCSTAATSARWSARMPP